MKATEQSFPVVLFIMLYKVVLTFESVGGILKYDHSNKQHFPVELFTKMARLDFLAVMPLHGMQL